MSLFLSSSNLPSDAPSTRHRKRRADRIDRLGEIVMRACRRCKDNGLVCRVHISSGKCSNCHRANARRCDARVTEVEWKKLGDQRKLLLSNLDQAKRELADAQSRLMQSHAKEMRLRKQLDAVDRRVEEGRSLEERAIAEEEEEERVLERNGVLLEPLPSSDLALTPLTWSAIDGFSDDAFWGHLDGVVGDPLDAPDPGGIVEGVPGSS